VQETDPGGPQPGHAERGYMGIGNKISGMKGGKNKLIKEKKEKK
jgi:hypothetical protein